jgi:prophage regulatory protein
MTDILVILRKAETSRRVGLSIRHLERLESAGKFPRRIHLSANSAGWLEAEVNGWLHQRVAASRNNVPST